MAGTQTDGTSVVVRALSRADARRRALRECRRSLGGDGWLIVEESITPCLVSLGGRPRLYEGRFVVRHS